jgi:hypothetical protein
MPLTSRQLYDRLRAQSGAKGDEALARELEIPLRSLQRLKQGKGAQYDRTVALLERAGLLTPNWSATQPAQTDAVAPLVDRLARLEVELVTLAATVERALTAIEANDYRIQDNEQRIGALERQRSRKAAGGE